MKVAKILIIDDHQIVIDGLVALFKDYPEYEVIGQANDGQEGIRATRILQPDIILMDIDMPVMNGIVCAQEIRKENREVKIIVLSFHFEKSIIRKLLQIGVDGYLIKNSDMAEMITALNTVRQGKNYFAGSVTLALASNHADQLAPDLKNESQLLSLLTDREIEILKAIADGLTSKEISKLLHISSRTVDSHRMNIMKKLKVNKVVGLIKFAIQSGLVK